ncbi:MAG TPA: methyltransferase domain-containing protein [Candidatus Omnitrophota bacterium]|nr:methyltransferase domain-containing protein [Candidatus Omnitrophota bacterium]
MNTDTHDTLEALCRKKAAFSRKLILQAIYRSWYQRISKHCITSGKTLEIGSGFGFSKTLLPACITSEILSSPWVDLVCDAQELPFKNSSLSNIIAIDVLHHIKNLKLFFEETTRVLSPKGRIVVTDMYVSPVSHCVLRWGHFEDFKSITTATKLFFEQTGDLIWDKDFVLKSTEIHDLIAYPLSGGFNYPSILPARLLAGIFRHEGLLKGLEKIMAFKTTVVLEKKGTQ